MSDTYLLKHSESLTAQAKSVFGEDFVRKAYLRGSTVCGCDASELRVRATHIDSRCLPNGAMDFDADNDIAVQFTSGRTVVFSSSEWGQMELLDDSAVTEVV